MAEISKVRFGGVDYDIKSITDTSLSEATIPADAGAVGDAIGDINTSLSPNLVWTLKKNVDGAGNISTNNYTALSDAIPVSSGDLVVRRTPSHIDNKSIIGYLTEFNGETFIRRNSFDTFGQKFSVSDPNTTHVRLAFGRISSSGVQITQSDVDTFFKAYVYRAMESVADFNSSAFINRGKISDLGYTSFGQCTEQGYYTFGSNDVSNIDDLPDGWTGGGILKVYKTGNVIWQNLSSNLYQFVRYGASGTWVNVKTDENAFVNRGEISALGYTSIGQCVEQGYYTFGSSDNLSDLPVGWTGGGLILVYKTGSKIWQRLISNIHRYIRYGTTAEFINEVRLLQVQYIAESGADNSDAKLNVFIPRNLQNVRTLYQMGHCVNQSVNSNVWRLMYMFRVEGSGTQRQLTRYGEWECALHLDGRDDFSGGIVHGDEVDTDVTVFVDGTLINITDANVLCNELKIVRHSNLYDPNDSTTIIAEHGVEYVYTLDGLKINQSIKWKVSETLTNCFLAMLPIVKVYSKYRYDDTSFDVVENNQEKYSVEIPGAKSVTEYSTDYDCSITMSIPIYPEGLPGGDVALITDNGGINYNKVYFPVCASGTSQIGELWKSTTVYRNK